MRILLVDDAKNVHSFVKALFESSDLEFDDAFNGWEALVKVKKGELFDLILLDWEMPEMDGVTTLSEIRALGNDTPIIMVTSKNDLEDVGKALEEGANEYVMKPFTKEILQEKILSVTGREVA